MRFLDDEVRDVQAYFDSARFEGITRLYSARQIAAQRGTIRRDYTVAREAAEVFYPLLRELAAEGRSITTFGPYSPSQAVAMKRSGITGIYLGGWATSAKGSKDEDPGPDLASYPLSRVPDEAAGIVRALLSADKNQHFLWDSTGMTEDEMTRFPAELGKLGFVFNFITYGGHQIDGVAAEEFSENLQKEGMLALARLQRKIRLVESPYQTPQTLVGGPRADSALMASSGRTATTKAMGKGSTQFQHLIHTEVPPALFEEWLAIWSKHYDLPNLKVKLRPHRAGSALLDCSVVDAAGERLANVVFAHIKDRNDKNILSVRDQNTFDVALRRKRLMMLVHLFLIHRYQIDSVHYVSPTQDNQFQTEHMKALGLFGSVAQEVGEIIVADVNGERIEELLGDDGLLGKLITKAK